jgi:hypothetical protein
MGPTPHSGYRRALRRAYSALPENRDREPFHLKGNGLPYVAQGSEATAERSMVELTGIEPVTSCLPDKRSSQLSYSPTETMSHRRGAEDSGNVVPEGGTAAPRPRMIYRCE